MSVVHTAGDAAVASSAVPAIGTHPTTLLCPAGHEGWCPWVGSPGVHPTHTSASLLTDVGGHARSHSTPILAGSWKTGSLPLLVVGRAPLACTQQSTATADL